MSRNVLQIGFFLLVTLAFGWLAFLIFYPYLSALFLAVVLVIVFNPLYSRIKLFLNGRETFAALITSAFALLVIFVPLIFIGVLLFQEAQDLYLHLAAPNLTSTFLAEQIAFLRAKIQSIAPSLFFDADVEGYISGYLGALTRNLGVIFSGFIQALVYVFITAFSFFFILRDGKKFQKKIVELSPLGDNYDEGILKKVKTAIEAVVRGSLVVALVQGILAGFGFLFFGVGQPALLGGITTIAALIPSVGTAIVVVPAVVYLFFKGSMVAALGLLLWGTLLVGLVDNFLRPFLLKKNVGIHPLLILLSVFGGIGFFGPIGFLAGPIVLSTLFALLEIYPSIVSGGK
ncbi:MAG: hypothetical protein COZ49_03755 [Candidatus Yonathbacteria bacterium CG_4_10_14_3_um_filter_47_65]|uniref:AI-2E family transporter n=2 Tax=Parcubacteria group TaxID=1794811 RepID=A0A2M8D9X0_9BACT|nr:MAG: hypothetical protein AUJ44_04200 [Candidatus Nomurabacteria bacterium CG1_02_47_685]PIP04227.1 MAG: hypothetical protein COX54_00245 [Candidatus Yonathbacteria bacterium CG23_combo_of_CG06-09_8_20_14_all_46_18]PIQ31619.1 MAG: hypothetical protein COW61_03535 [Candidatus Yonathbacteria bacterium CG17_big_fil_post_rev_8_21_14_2_50_46_19]PIX56122.1 MAG: hypothetical protein COZ49_03755 [Candidatus Yonathbacteria bacterium CG_4_10_14_3_um_filter_47_65]PIY57698.1 MAG: hypothetical protein CO